MTRMLDFERPLKMLQSASDFNQVLLIRGRTDLNLWRPILLKLNFYHGLVDHTTGDGVYLLQLADQCSLLSSQQQRYIYSNFEYLYRRRSFSSPLAMTPDFKCSSKVLKPIQLQTYT